MRNVGLFDEVFHLENSVFKEIMIKIMWFAIWTQLVMKILITIENMVNTQNLFWNLNASRFNLSNTTFTGHLFLTFFCLVSDFYNFIVLQPPCKITANICLSSFCKFSTSLQRKWVKVLLNWQKTTVIVFSANQLQPNHTTKSSEKWIPTSLQVFLTALFRISTTFSLWCFELGYLRFYRVCCNIRLPLFTGSLFSKLNFIYFYLLYTN